MCPICLSWWTGYLNKNNQMYCGCTTTDKAIGLQKKTYGNRYLAKEPMRKDCQINYKGVDFRFYLDDGLTNQQLDSTMFTTILKEHPELQRDQILLRIALRKLYNGSSQHSVFERCGSCKHFRGSKACAKGIGWKSEKCTRYECKLLK